MRRFQILLTPSITAYFLCIVVPSTSLFAVSAGAEQNGQNGQNGQSSPVGLWQAVDEETHQATALISIKEYNGELRGQIVKLLDPQDQEALCTKCKGRRKNQPLKGLVILWGLKRSKSGWWDGGHVLDPDEGKTYRCRIKLRANGKKLAVRGYLGIPAIGVTQIWNRLR